jgi:CRISPR/Cas system CMR subunit Cmr6 (Cas7 group RAMP superfamily)
MPRLAGSGLKGLLRHWLFKNQARLPEQERRQLTKDKLEALFGNDADSPRPVGGLLTVHDAWWDPASTRGPLEAERATSHLPGEDGQAAEFRGPNPVPRIAVAGTMLFAIDHDAVGDVWASRCLDWLHHALADEGAGAARQQGYGRFVSPTAS